MKKIVIIISLMVLPFVAAFYGPSVIDRKPHTSGLGGYTTPDSMSGFPYPTKLRSCTDVPGMCGTTLNADHVVLNIVANTFLVLAGVGVCVLWRSKSSQQRIGTRDEEGKEGKESDG